MTKLLHEKPQHPKTADACYCYCPRCHHAVRFQQALSDGAWVCQKCLRYRVYTPDVETIPVTREPVHA